MQTYTNKRNWKVALLIFAILIGIVSVSYTNKLVKQMKAEEIKNMEVWAEATRYLANENVQNMKFYCNIIEHNTTIPIILCDNNDSIAYTYNINSKKINDNEYLQKRIQKMKEQHPPIIINFQGGKNTLYYEDSTILKQLHIYPYVQLSIIAIFIAIAYFAFSNARKAEQNRVWAGMAKETAHQLGTPISSLMAWSEFLKADNNTNKYADEIDKDINRLQVVAERFSKIGSQPELSLCNLSDLLQRSLKYMQSRTSDKIKFSFTSETDEKIIMLNHSLFTWVIENILKNAVDAIKDKGDINIHLSENEKYVSIKISDTGKGIPKNKYKMVFQPGYTSKTRGWGLGLSLAKRIVEQYHKGKIMVEHSEINKGTTFRINLPIA